MRTARSRALRLPSLALLLLAGTAPALAAGGEDWPTHRHDGARSGRTSETLAARRLTLAWTHASGRLPRPAWPGPARWDAFAGLRGLKSMRNYDPVFHAIAVEDAVFFGSSADDSVYRLDAGTGEVEWSFATEGPVRVTPTWDAGRLYFGSDDGRAYCVDAATGAERWRFQAAPGARRLINDGRLISPYPVRTGVLVADGVAYSCASLLPWKPSFVCAVDAETGELTGDAARRPTFVKELGTGWTMEGPLLLSAQSLVVPQGRVAPLVFERDTGESRGALPGGGGCFALLTDDEHVLHGPGNKQGWITDSSTETREEIASYERGNAIVVAGETAYMLSDRSLAALDRASQAVLWSVSCDAPYELILAGDVLFCGGRDLVEARSAADGTLLWRGEVRGRAYGLAVARGRLLVSTDEGHSACFVEGQRELPLPAVAAEEGPLLGPPPPITPLRDSALLDRWVFQSDGVEHRQLAADDPRTTPVFVNQVRGGREARCGGALELVQAGEVHALALDGRSSDLSIAEDFRQARMPERGISAEAWVRVDAPMEWGGILGAAQDNGDFERGWILGYRQRRFGFALNAENGPDRLTWLLADRDYEPGRWHHVVGTYDGKTQRIFVDGELAGESDAQRGDLRYPERAFYHAGAYRDDDEYFRAKGALHELCLYRKPLSARTIARRWRAKKDLFPEPEAPPEPAVEETIELARGPILRFAAGAASVEWTTAEAARSWIELEREGSVQVLPPGTGFHHRAVFMDLRRATVYPFRIAVERDGEVERTRTFECDTHFDFALDRVGTSYFPPGRERDPAADSLVEEVGASSVRSGFAVLLGTGGSTAEAARRLASRSGLRVVVLATDAKAAAGMRSDLASPLSGVPPVVLDVGSEGPLGLPPAFAKLLLATPQDEAVVKALLERGALKLLHPYRGKAILPGFESAEAPGAPEGAGAWTHMYGRPDNSAYGGESLGGARSVDELEVQWIGPPGPRHQSDRQNRKPSPLAVNGRLFVQGLNRVTALDAYDGEVLWALELPELQRFNVPRSSSNWCADEESLYLAMRDRVEKVAAATGAIVSTFRLAPSGGGAGEREWGYVARLGHVLLGSETRAGTHFTEFWGGDKWYDAKEGENAAKVCSDRLFALDAESGRELWSRARGLVIEPTITAADGRVYFVECRDPALIALETRRVAGPKLWADLHLVCLEAGSGRVVWEREAQPMPGEVAFYLAHSDGRLVLLSSDAGSFALYVLDAADGQSLWRKKFQWEVDHHGKHLSRPLIVGGRLFVRPLAFDLESGDDLGLTFPEGHQCGTYVAAQDSLILRAGELCVWDHQGERASRWSRLRPDCWISTIPACGMLLSPEGGGGCSCGSWLETSLGFLPKERAAPR